LAFTGDAALEAFASAFPSYFRFRQTVPRGVTPMALLKA
jgi:hypothetical protein